MTYHLRSRAALCAALLLSLAAVWVSASEPEPDWAQAHRAASRSLVRVLAVVPSPTSPVYESATFSNTGFLAGEDGDIITSLPAVVGSIRIRVVHADGSDAPAQVASVDQAAGLVLLKSQLSGYSPLEVAEELPEPGDRIALAFGATPTTTEETDGLPHLEPALVRARDASIRLSGVRWDGLLKVSTRVCNGCAAAPLLDRTGRLVGVVLAVRSPAPLSSTLQECEVYGLPAPRLQEIVARMRRGESRRLGWLGVAVAEEPTDREGARVAAVLEDSPAHLAGIRAGDLLLQIGQRTIETPSAVAEIVAQTGPTSGLRVKLLRGGEIKMLAVNLAPRPLAICSLPPYAATERPATVQQIIEENYRLRARVWELEQKRRQLQDYIRRLEELTP